MSRFTSSAKKKGRADRAASGGSDNGSRSYNETSGSETNTRTFPETYTGTNRSGEDRATGIPRFALCRSKKGKRNLSSDEDEGTGEEDTGSQSSSEDKGAGGFLGLCCCRSLPMVALLLLLLSAIITTAVVMKSKNYIDRDEIVELEAQYKPTSDPTLYSNDSAAQLSLLRKACLCYPVKSTSSSPPRGDNHLFQDGIITER